MWTWNCRTYVATTTTRQRGLLDGDAHGLGEPQVAAASVLGGADHALHCANGIHHFRASVAPGNARSENLIRKLGFVQTGQQWDDRDGLELVYELRV